MYAILRVRGEVGVRRDIRRALELLRLHRVNHLALVPQSSMHKKMIEKVKDYVTYGEIDEKTLVQLLSKRARLHGNKLPDSEFMKNNRIKGFEGIAKSILSGEKKLADFGIKPVLRLRPPRKGFERAGIKKPYAAGGALGYRGAEIGEIIARMI